MPTTWIFPALGQHFSTLLPTFLHRLPFSIPSNTKTENTLVQIDISFFMFVTSPPPTPLRTWAAERIF